MKFDLGCNRTLDTEHSTVTINVEGMEHFILQTKDKDYVLDFQKLLEDYGVEVDQ